MVGKGKSLVLIGILLGCLLPQMAAAGWNLDLPETVVLDGDVALLRDVASGPVPAAARDLVIRAGLKPGSVVTVSRQDILRRLVTAGLAHGVRMTGARECRLEYYGRQLETEDLNREIRRLVQPLMPTARPGAPDSWFELEVPEAELAVAGDWKVAVDRKEGLEPGRNLVRIEIVNGDRRESFPATVILHQFGEVARAVKDLSREQPLKENLFTWQWQDLADLERGLAIGRSRVAGASLTRNLAAGAKLREADLKETPLILAGDSVELQVRRGQVAVTVRAFARQNGCLGQTIPVRSELTGRLVNARVAGPGLVEWRR